MKTQAIFTVLVLSVASIASAQTTSNNLYVPQNSSTVATGGYMPGSDYSGAYGPIYTHSSTAEEGILRGAGDYVRSWGDYNNSTSQAMINREEARRRAIDNQRHNTETFFAMRRMNAEAVSAERGPRATPETLARYAREDAPSRLTNYQYEPALGKIFWPESLSGTEFAAERKQIDDLARTGELNVKNKEKIRAVVTEMGAKLKDNIGSHEPADYLLAKKFLASLDFESRFANAPTNVASR